MKLNEILDTQVRKTRYDGEFTNKGYGWRPHPDEDDDNVIKQGSYYGAYSKKDNPHEVDKLSLDAREEGRGDDGQAEYVIRLVERKITGNNIFAPRIYDFNKTQDDNGFTHISFTEETLLDADDVSLDEVELIIEQIFSPEQIKSVRKAAVEYTFDVGTEQARLTGGIGYEFMSQIKHGNISTLSDDLNELLVLIRELVSEGGGGFWLDIHDENIMYRRTSTGLQLVISDPVS